MSLNLRAIENWSKIKKENKFFLDVFDKEDIKDNLLIYSSKALELIKNIKKLDEQDLKNEGKLFKHYIFTDEPRHGGLMLASTMLSFGYNLCYDFMKSNKITLKSDTELKETEKKNFALITSSSLGKDKKMKLQEVKTILNKFNQRPENVNGDLIRIVILDKGFKEGIDLYDVKYAHIYEIPTSKTDQKQAIGRATRNCGQAGLDFIKDKGWVLDTYIYSSLLDDKRLFDLYMANKKDAYAEINIKIIDLLEKMSLIGSVDYDLNYNIHKKKEKDLLIESLDLGELVGGAVKFEKPDCAVTCGVPNFPIVKEKMNFVTMKNFVKNNYSKFKWDPIEIKDNCNVKRESGDLQFNNTQNFIRNFFHADSYYKGMLLAHSVGTGKCHLENTPILMYDGSIKMVQNVEVGDKVMGDDSSLRNVLSLGRGRDTMYKISYSNNESYTVNSEHILVLKYSGNGRISKVGGANGKNFPYHLQHMDNNKIKIKTERFKTKEEALEFKETLKESDSIIKIEVKDYLKLPNYIKRDLKGIKTGVEFAKKDLSFDPYILGLWLGDGTSRGTGITINDKETEIIKYLENILPEYDLQLKKNKQKYCYNIQVNENKQKNYFSRILNFYNLKNNKHIPNDYKINSRKNRLELLAGLIDSDGHLDSRVKTQYEITQKNEKLAKDILYLVRSLGFGATMKQRVAKCKYKGEVKECHCYRILFSGKGVEEIPVRLSRKRAIPRKQIKNPLVLGIKVEEVGEDNYYGFTLDGNHKFLLGDFTITHNTCSAISLASSSYQQKGYTILWVTRTSLKADMLKNMISNDKSCNAIIKHVKKTENRDLTVQEMKDLMKEHGWGFDAMSYKQFTNLVSGKNKQYKILKEKNGSSDILKKTLIIIDEAHKLYGGFDLKPTEKPNMEKFYKMIQNSYTKSGSDSARLLLMTATPIVKDPMEFNKLLNLLRPESEKLTEDKSQFIKKYLTNKRDLDFSRKSKIEFLNEITGYISYLDRSTDPSQFTQPNIKMINVCVATEQDYIKSLNISFEEYTEFIKEKQRIKEIKQEYEIKKKECKNKKCKDDNTKEMNKIIKDLKESNKKMKVIQTKFKDISQYAVIEEKSKSKTKK